MGAYGLTAHVYKHFGAAPTYISSVDSYMALKLGTVDAYTYDDTGMFDLSFHEVAKYYTLPKVNVPAYLTLLVNKKAWDSLPKDLKDIFMEAHEKYNYIMAAQVQHALLDKIIKGQKEYNCSWRGPKIIFQTACISNASVRL